MSEALSELTTAIIYHRSCMDGAAAAVIARKHHPKALLIAAQYGERPPDHLPRTVFILDFSYPREEMLMLSNTVPELVVLDHHKTAQEALAGLDFCTFDMSKCGARLTWEWFDKGPAPWWVDYIEDRDLWKWELPHSREINAALRSHGMTPDQLERTVTEFTEDDLRADGAAIMRFQQQVVMDHIKHAVSVELCGISGKAVNATCLFSEIAGRLAEGEPFGATYFISPSGEKVWQLRSRDGGVDVSKIAKSMGGGGHTHAAGFTEAVK